MPQELDAFTNLKFEEYTPEALARRVLGSYAAFDEIVHQLPGAMPHDSEEQIVLDVPQNHAVVQVVLSKNPHDTVAVDGYMKHSQFGQLFLHADRHAKAGYGPAFDGFDGNKPAANGRRALFNTYTETDLFLALLAIIDDSTDYVAQSSAQVHFGTKQS